MKMRVFIRLIREFFSRDEKIKNLERISKIKVMEINRNGTIVVKNILGNEMRYSEKYVSMTRYLLDDFKGEDAHDLGYRVGFREGMNVREIKKEKQNNIISFPYTPRPQP